jgi:hypothetical protein
MSINQETHELKKQTLIDKFLFNDRVESDEERDKAFEELSFEIYKLQFAKDDYPDEETNKRLRSFKEKMAQLECNDPRLAHAVNGINKIGRSKYGEASKYVEEYLKALKEDFSTVQRTRANASRPDRLSDLIQSFLSHTPNMTTGNVMRRLRDEVGNGVIDEITDEYIYYFPTPPIQGKEVPSVPSKLSGLKNRVSRLKTTLSKKI